MPEIVLVNICKVIYLTIETQQWCNYYFIVILNIRRTGVKPVAQTRTVGKCGNTEWNSTSGSRAKTLQ